MPLPLKTLRRSAAELLAYAVSELFPGAKLVESEITDIDFHYDFVVEQPLDEQAIPLIEERMRALIKDDLPLKSFEMMRQNAIEFLRHHHQDIKADILSAQKDKLTELVQIGDFIDPCAGPLTASSKEIGVFKIIKIEPVSVHVPELGELQAIRIQGTAFPDPQALKKFLKKADAAKKRDHRQIGREMDLYSIHEDAGSGFWFWHPKGTIIRDILLDWWRKAHSQQKFKQIVTPRFVKPGFMKKSGFRENPEGLFPGYPHFSSDGKDYASCPSLSPLHALLFRSKLHSYREFPVRYAECAELFTHERTGQHWGLFKGSMYYADIAHIFCMPQQVLNELISSLQFINETVKIFGFEYQWYLVSRGQKFAGTLDLWDKTLNIMIKALETNGFNYTEDQAGKAFDGPRLEVRFFDALGREWKGPFVGLDFNLPERLGLRYQGSDGEMHIPAMLTRATFGSLERFIAILVEHYAGHFPLWLAPEQVRVIPVGEGNFNAAGALLKKVEEGGFRAGIDYRHERLGAKIHAAESEKIPYMIIVGEKEEKNGLITVRSCNQEKAKAGIGLEDFLAKLKAEASTISLAHLFAGN